MVVMGVQDAAPSHLHNRVVVQVVERHGRVAAVLRVVGCGSDHVALHQTVSDDLLHEVALRRVHVGKRVERRGPVFEESNPDFRDYQLDRARQHHDDCVVYGVRDLPGRVVAQMRKDLPEVLPRQELCNDP